MPSTIRDACNTYIASLVLFSIGFILSLIKLYLHSRNTVRKNGTIGFYFGYSYRTTFHYMAIAFMISRIIFASIKIVEYDLKDKNQKISHVSSAFYFFFSRAATFFLFIAFCCTVIHLYYYLYIIYYLGCTI